MPVVSAPDLDARPPVRSPDPVPVICPIRPPVAACATAALRAAAAATRPPISILLS